MEYKSALVTGASKGIGAAIAAEFVSRGLTVYALGRDPAGLEKLSASLGSAIRPVVADVRAHEKIAAALQGCEIDVLVNNAGGLSTVRPLHQQTAEETDEVIALNLTAPLQLIRLLLPGMIERRRGHIFNLTSTAASAVFAGTTAYGAAKAGLSHAGKILRYDLAGTGIRLTEIAPGRVETEFYLKAFDGKADILREKMYTAERPLRPADIAAAVGAALGMPRHANVSEIVISPSEQASGGYVYPAFEEK